MASESWRTGTVIDIKDETYNTKRYFIRVNDSKPFDFQAGQFVTLDLPVHHQNHKRWHSYSIASWPDGTDMIELLVVLLNGGAGTTYLFNEIKAGSRLLLRGPQGRFTLPEIIDKDLFLICTGTGIAPFRSMLNDIMLRHLSHKNIYLIYGCRSQKDLLYFHEMSLLEQKLEDFHFMPTLSGESWNGHNGYVHVLYEQICRKNNEGCQSAENLTPALFYLCGRKFMIDEAGKKIAELGYDKAAIRQELYG